jgi:prepilin-type N-terminal cleavage/methylation domain-containing protein
MAKDRARGRGFSLLEIGLALAIISVLVASAMTFYNNVTNQSKTKDLLDEFNTVVLILHTLGQSDPDYQDWLTPYTVAQSGMLPSKWVRATGRGAGGDAQDANGTNIANPFGGAVLVQDTAFNGYGGYFLFITNGLPTAACEAIATMNPGAVVFEEMVDDVPVSFPMTPAQAATACNATPTASQQAISSSLLGPANGHTVAYYME